MLEQKSQYNKANNLFDLQHYIGYYFRDPKLLSQALTRRSAINSGIQNSSIGHNENLEFLGDRVLNLVMADVIKAWHAEWDEGHLSETHARLVQNSTLAGIAKKIKLGEYLLMDSGEVNNSNGKQNKKILADSLEAIIGAIYLDADRNLKILGKFVQKHWYELQPILFELTERLAKAERDEESHEQLTSQVVELVKLGADIKMKNSSNKTMFHLMGCQPGLMEEILKIEKDWSGIDLREVSKELFDGYEYATDDLYYQPLNFIELNFYKANLSGVCLSSRTMYKVNFSDAVLCGADLSSVKFKEVTFRGANLQGVNLKNCVMDPESRKSYYEAVEEGRAPKFEIKILEEEFWEAVNNNNVIVIKEFLVNNNKIDSSTGYNNTAIEIQDTNGLTALHIAAGKGFEEMARLLLSHGANPSIEVKKHQWVDPRDMLSLGSIRNIMQMTMKIGSVPITNATPLELARGNGHKNIEAMLLENLGRGRPSQSTQEEGKSRISIQPEQKASNNNLTHRQEILSRYGNANERQARSNNSAAPEPAEWCIIM